MTRITKGIASLKIHKKYLKLAKGFRGVNSRLSTFAMEQIIQSLNSSYIGKKLKKRNYRRISLITLNSFFKFLNLQYFKVLDKLKKNNIYLNNKILSLLAKKNSILLTQILTNNIIIANIAQLVEHLICNQKVMSSNLIISFFI